MIQEENRLCLTIQHITYPAYLANHYQWENVYGNNVFIIWKHQTISWYINLYLFIQKICDFKCELCVCVVTSQINVINITYSNTEHNVNILSEHVDGHIQYYLLTFRSTFGFIQKGIQMVVTFLELIVPDQGFQAQPWSSPRQTRLTP